MKIAVCAGGTGGHLFPAVALTKELEKRGHDVLLVTDRRGASYCEDIENKDIVFSLRFSLKSLISFGYKAFLMLIHFLFKWRRDRPEVVVGFGGLLTVVPIVIARIYGAKVILYEQNSIIGKANRYLSKLADLKLSTFSIGYGWTVQNPPVRPEFLSRKPFKSKSKIKVLIIGGSQGARSFSKIIPEAMSRLPTKFRKELEIIQQESYGDTEALSQRYSKMGISSKIEEFIYDVADVMEQCQLVICRAGASTLSELSAIGRPAILIPYPLATGNHQLLNAQRYAAKNAAWVIEESPFAAEKLKRILEQIFRNPELLKKAALNIMNGASANASEQFAQVIEQLGASK